MDQEDSAQPLTAYRQPCLSPAALYREDSFTTRISSANERNHAKIPAIRNPQLNLRFSRPSLPRLIIGFALAIAAPQTRLRGTPQQPDQGWMAGGGPGCAVGDRHRGRATRRPRRRVAPGADLLLVCDGHPPHPPDRRRTRQPRKTRSQRRKATMRMAGAASGRTRVFRVTSAARRDDLIADAEDCRRLRHGSRRPVGALAVGQPPPPVNPLVS